MENSNDNNFSSHTQNSYLVVEILQTILKTPFISKLIDGSLRKKIFNHYLIQDSFYLLEHLKTLEEIAKQFTGTEYHETFSLLSKKSSLERFWLIETLGFEPKHKTTPTTSCFAYTNHLFNMSKSEFSEIAVATILPCYWIYGKAIQHIKKHAKMKNHPYQNWIKTYSDPEFKKDANKLTLITNKMAKNASLSVRKEMEHAFIQSCLHELRLWESSYRIK